MCRSSSDGETSRFRKTSLIRFTRRPEHGARGVRAPGKKQGRRAAAATLSARLVSHVTLQAHADGNLAARFYGHSVALGKFSAGAIHRAQSLREGLPFDAFAPDRSKIGSEIDRLVRQLATSGLLEYL